MTVRRRRWLRRFAIGVSIAAFAAPAAAQARRRAGAEEVCSMEQPAVRPDDRADRFAGGQQMLLASNSLRPDDRANRFAISDGVTTATPPRSTDSSVSWDGAVKFGLAALVLVLALGLGISYVRRPRIAGLYSPRGQRENSVELEAGRQGPLSAGPARCQSRVRRAVPRRGRGVLAGREHVLVTRAARRQLHDPHVVVPASVAAGVRGSFVQLRQREATGQKAHEWDLSWRLCRRRSSPQFAHKRRRTPGEAPDHLTQALSRG